MGNTAKVKTAGRFGSRYGVGIRKRVIKVERVQKKKHKCPQCGFNKVKRLSAGIFECRKCSIKFAGGAYTPETMSGGIVKKMVSQKSFLPRIKELLEVKEEGTEAKAEETVEEEKPEEKSKVEKKAKKPTKKKTVKKEKSTAKKEAKPKKEKKEKSKKEKK